MNDHNSEPKPSPQELNDEDLSTATGGAFNTFINFGDIKGESTNDNHKDWISILSYQSGK